MPRHQETPFGLRMPKGMREQVKQLATENGRSMNAEIIFRLREAIGMEAGGTNGHSAPAGSTSRGETHDRP